MTRNRNSSGTPARSPETGAGAARSDSEATPSLAERAAAFDRVALVLQGGGALGAYQVGVWEVLTEAGIEPTWISGVSIGAINAAIIAGNPRERRVARLHEFWDRITTADTFAGLPGLDFFRQAQNQWSALSALTIGQNGFFRPRMPNPWFLPKGSAGATSFYDSSELEATLSELIDFDLLNDGPMRLSVGAVDVESGNFTFFDTKAVDHAGRRHRLGPKHVMASGALPPALPAIEIDGRHYWDGGIVSNTPLAYLLEQEEDLSSLVFQVDLFPASGRLPQDIAEVLARQKDITYSSRTRANTDEFARRHALKCRLREALLRVPEAARTDEDRAFLADFEKPGVVNILHLIYQTKAWEADNKDYEFSARSAAEHRAAGRADASATLRRHDWFTLADAATGYVVHDVHHPAARGHRIG